MLQYAFKEWAVICEALAQGKQSIILRKGGIAENSGEFGVEHHRFWLYPTFVHQQKDGIQDDALPLLQQAEAHRPTAGTVRLRLWAAVTGIYDIRDELAAMLLGHLHCWSDSTIEQRFNYRTPGLYVLVVRVYQIPKAHEIAELPAYAGCRSWVELACALSTEGSTPVVDDKDYRIVQKQLDTLLAPTGLA